MNLEILGWIAIAAIILTLLFYSIFIIIIVEVLENGEK